MSKVYCRARAAVAFGAAGTLCALLAFACTKEPARPPVTAEKAPAEPPPILVIGLDGFEWSVAAPLVAAGRMPELTKLLARGRASKLATLEPTLSPVIWTSIATSKAPEEHGITGFVHRELVSGAERLFDRRDRHGKAVWSIFSDAGYKVRVIGWWLTWPAERVHGVVVAQTNALQDAEVEGRMWKGRLRKDVPRQVHPPERQDEMLAVATEVEETFDARLQEIFGELLLDPDSLGGRLWQNSRWSLLADEIYRRIALHLAEKDGRADLSLVYFGGADVLGHRFWRYAFPGGYRYPPTETERAALGGLIERYYVHLDRVIGELVGAWPEGTDVFVVSDHGMLGCSYDRQFHSSLSLPHATSAGHADAPPGVLVAAGPSIRRGGSPFDPAAFRAQDLDVQGRVHDLTPTWLALFDIPRGKDMRGSILYGWLEKGSALLGRETEIPSHDLVPAAFPDDASGVIDPAEAARLEQFRSLGYVGGDLDPAKKRGSESPPPEPPRKDGGR